MPDGLDTPVDLPALIDSARRHAGHLGAPSTEPFHFLMAIATVTHATMSLPTAEPAVVVAPWVTPECLEALHREAQPPPGSVLSGRPPPPLSLAAEKMTKRVKARANKGPLRVKHWIQALASAPDELTARALAVAWNAKRFAPARRRLARFLERSQGAVGKVAARWREDRREIVNDLYIRLVGLVLGGGLREDEIDEKPVAFLRQLARNALCDEARREGATVVWGRGDWDAITPGQTLAGIEESLARENLHERLERAMQELTPHERAFIQGVYAAGNEVSVVVVHDRSGPCSLAGAYYCRRRVLEKLRRSIGSISLSRVDASEAREAVVEAVATFDGRL